MPKATPLMIRGKVTAKSPYGIKMDGGEEWINFSKPEYREEPWEWEDVQKDDWVEIKRSGNFFKSICLVEPPTGEPMVMPEDPFEGIETEPPSDTAGWVPREMARSHIATDREQSIQRQVALKAAVELAIAMLGPVPEGQRAGPVNAAYVVAIYRQFRDALNETE